MLSHFFIRRPIFAAVISIVIMLLGGFAMLSLPIERYPEIAPPQVTVSAIYPGANAQTVAETVASPIEQEVNGVENMLYMSSVSANDGTMSLTVTFATGVDQDMSNVLTQNRVSKAQSQLPQEVQRLGVTVKKKSAVANMYVALTSPDGTYDDIFLSNYLELRIKDEVARVNGVGEVQTFGVGKYAMRIWLDPQKLTAREVSVSEIVSAVQQQNVQVAAGAIGEPPAPAGQPFQLTVNVEGRLVDPEQFADIIIRSTSDGGALRIRDVARVEIGSESYRLASSFNGKDCAAFAIYQIPGANAIQVVDGVKGRLAELSKNFPQGVSYDIVYDDTVAIEASIAEVVETLFITLLLVVFTVYVFLQNFRATLIPSLTIPVSLIGTFAVMSVMGFSINTLTLFGLVLVIGIVVDDAIVVVENCTLNIEEHGMDPKAAAMKTMTEVTGPVIATTLVLLAVFIPTAFMSGISGILFKQFALTIAIATVFSSINALTLSPALCGVLLKKSSGKTPWFFRMFNKGMDSTTRGYHGVVKLALRKSAIGVVLFAGLIVLSGLGFVNLPGGFVPQEDEGYCITSVQLPEAAALDRTRAVMDQVDDVIKEVPGVARYLTISGFSLIDGAVASNTGFAVVVFKDWSVRPPEEHQSAIITGLNRRLSQLQDCLAFSFPTPSLPGLGLSGGFTFMLEDREGVGLQTLQNVADQVISGGNAQTALSGMYTPFRANVPQLFVDVNREQVMNRGMTLGSIWEALQTYLGSNYINDYTNFGRVFKVYAQAESDYRAQPSDIGKLEIKTPQGEMAPLANFIDVEETLGPQTITRFNMYPSVKIMGSPSPGFSSGAAMDVIESMAEKNLPSAFGYDWTDLSYQEKMAQGGVIVIFGLAIALVYLVLAAQYESWTLPISVCLSVPTALLGAVAALMVRGYDNNVYTKIGIVLLIGLSTKSAILIVEFAKAQRDTGMPIFDAALSAARLRFRAVLMTAFSFILGVIPLLIATGAGSESRKAIGTAVFGGMVVATVVSVIVVPMLYYVVQACSEKFGKKPAPVQEST
ncbi:efflux RND transporter permease subunit [Cerasicoccus arenae]|uniref:Multidrug efflux RND transporter permease subunit n=1 Tax=Cerasicoccus arenae TaxID=424488 RepID=A0A8J3GD54_9BACT|nr:multidrug efflux RND transporter permease subunit [Cerasicoccus arenae]MBK1859301.1 multidrug efflux RND transporter permease subunit [Cerasicoccus arenae]GHB94301.1 multidrug efflux RND transporter permease subunit [Cerasicoccus arenae]